MNSAVVDQATLIVINIIVANPDIDPAPDGCLLIGLSEGTPCDIGWIYNPADGTFTNPNPTPPDVAVI